MKKILKTIACCLGALAIAFTAFFVPNINKSASASSVNTSNTISEGMNWVSDNIQLPFGSAYSSGGNINSPSTYFSIVAVNFKMTITGVSLNGYNINLQASSVFGQNDYINSFTNLTTINYSIPTTGDSVICSIREGSNSSYYLKFYFLVIPSEGYPTFNMKTYERGYYTSFKNNVSSDYFGFPSLDSFNDYFTIHSFTDTNNWRYMFVFRHNFVQTSSSGLNYQIFYNLASVDFSDNDIYNEGYNQGYNQGLTTGTNEGYSDGYSTGYDVGFGNGRNEGIQNANNYSFLGLFGAIVDAPLTGLRSLFNFEFLGINLLSFITSLLTIALITFVIKKLMGR